MDLKLCRYTPLCYFQEMLETKQLVFISPRKWDDKYESYLFQALKTEQGRKIAMNYIRALPDYREGVEEKVVAHICAVYNSTFCLCFSEDYDSEQMWSARVRAEDGIMYVTSESKVQSISEELIIDQVTYDLTKEITLKDELNRLSIFDGTTGIWGTNDLITHKRPAFNYENEVRAIYFDFENSGKDLVRIPIPDITSLVDGAMVSPKASDETYESAEILCKMHSIQFLGKSKVYQLNEII